MRTHILKDFIAFSNPLKHVFKILESKSPPNWDVIVSAHEERASIAFNLSFRYATGTLCSPL